MTLDIRVALQGGGAKLANLIAAADALQELEERGIVKITKVAGTSAGSIVACMLASGEPMSSFREKTVVAGKSVIDDFAKIRSKSLLGPLPNMWDLYFGTPLLKEEKLKLFLESLFGRESTLGDLTVPTCLIASDINSRGKWVFFRRAENLVASIATSCALPFAFRTYKDEESLVDGGLVSNFPAEELIKDNPEQDSILGFSFKTREEEKPDSLLSYLAVLASTAIEGNVDFNAERIKEVGGEVCLLNTSLRTMDFSDALKMLEDEQVAYQNAKDQAKLEIEAKVRILQDRSRAVKRAAGQSTHEKFRRIHNAMKRQHPYHISRSSTLIIARGLIPRMGGERNDQIISAVQLRPSPPNDRIFSLRIGIPSSDGSAPRLGGSDDIRVSGPNGAELNATMQVIERSARYYAVLVLDEPCVLRESESLTVHLRADLKGALDQLTTYGRAAVRAGGSDGSTHAREILLAIPESIGETKLFDLLDQIPSMQDQGLSYTREEMIGKWSVGKPMTEEQLDSSRLELGLKFPLADFALSGWRTDSLESDEFCGVCIVNPNFDAG
ncbi:MAG: patatin-like phospholipase family protein [Pseudomonadota bacterium]